VTANPKTSIAAVLASLSLLTLPSTGLPSFVAAAATYAECDSLQANDNTWIARDNSTTIGSPYAWRAQAKINWVNYALCSVGLFNPIVSGSSAWVAIEGPGSSDIVQLGVMKCSAYAAVCGNGMDRGVVDWFYAWGVTGDPFKQPWPNNLGVADHAAHTYKVTVVGGDWFFDIDNVAVKTISDSWRSWHAIRVQQAVEILNEGDQLGGGPTTHQTFRNGAYWVGATKYTTWGSVYKTGHCYPWGVWATINGVDFDAWTVSPHTNC
jgi:hypothetical protein